MAEVAATIGASPPGDTWRFRRILIAGITGALCGAYSRALNFWPVGTADLARGFLDLLGLPLLLLTVVVLPLLWFVVAAIAVFRREWRRMTSNILAIATIAVGPFAVGAVPWFDPWFWYVVLNEAELDAAARGKVPVGGEQYVVIGEWDISTGFAGASVNNFVALVYDGSDGTPTDPSNPYQKHVYGHFYLRHRYE